MAIIAFGLVLFDLAICVTLLLVLRRESRAVRRRVDDAALRAREWSRIREGRNR